MNRKDFVKDYLQFTHKERIAILALVLLIVFLMILPHLFPGASAAHSIKADTTWMVAAGRLLQKAPDTVYYYRRKYDSGSYQQRYPYNNDRRNYYPRYQYAYRYTSRDTFSKRSYPGRPARKIEDVEINTADSTAWEALPGIGPVLAARIIRFRDKLGGFYTIEQVREVYGIQDSTFQLIDPYLKLNKAGVRKININTATKDDLKMHPYIRWQLANNIVNYRAQHGNFASLDDLKKMQQMTDEIYSKIEPYLSL